MFAVLFLTCPPAWVNLAICICVYLNAGENGLLKLKTQWGLGSNLDSVIPSAFLSVVLIAAIPAQAHAAGFPCGKAVTKVEKMICDDDELSADDEELSRLYQAIIGAAKDREQVKGLQTSWLEDVRNKCADTACLIDAYITRTEELRKAIWEIPAESGVEFRASEYYEEKDVYTITGKKRNKRRIDLGTYFSCVRLHASDRVTLIDFDVYFPDTGQTLTASRIPVKTGRSGVLEFRFVDGWLNRGKGTFKKTADKGVLTLEVDSAFDEPAAKDILRQYDSYTLKQGPCKVH